MLRFGITSTSAWRSSCLKMHSAFVKSLTSSTIVPFSKISQVTPCRCLRFLTTLNQKVNRSMTNSSLRLTSARRTLLKKLNKDWVTFSSNKSVAWRKFNVKQKRNKEDSVQKKTSACAKNLKKHYAKTLWSKSSSKERARQVPQVIKPVKLTAPLTLAQQECLANVLFSMILYLSLTTKIRMNKMSAFMAIMMNYLFTLIFSMSAMTRTQILISSLPKNSSMLNMLYYKVKNPRKRLKRKKPKF